MPKLFCIPRCPANSGPPPPVTFSPLFFVYTITSDENVGCSFHVISIIKSLIALSNVYEKNQYRSMREYRTSVLCMRGNFIVFCFLMKVYINIMGRDTSKLIW